MPLIAHTVLALYDPQADTKFLLMPPPVVLVQCFAEKPTGIETSSLCFLSIVRDRD